jgi:tetratricopeptide (TPR) repeat protein
VTGTDRKPDLLDRAWNEGGRFVRLMGGRKEVTASSATARPWTSRVVSPSSTSGAARIPTTTSSGPTRLTVKPAASTRPRRALPALVNEHRLCARRKAASGSARYAVTAVPDLSKRSTATTSWPVSRLRTRRVVPRCCRGQQKLMTMSWVVLDRICEERRISDPSFRRQIDSGNRPLRSRAVHFSDAELLEKLREFGLDVDRGRLERLCEGALSAEEVARPLMDDCGFQSDQERVQGEWIWVCLTALWLRWWPDKVCLELLDDKIQAGYAERGDADRAVIWLSAWSDVLRLCDVTGICSINEFDDRFPMTQSLYNWNQDLELELRNAGLNDPAFVRARIEMCSEVLRRFPDEDQLMTENHRRAVAESYSDLGESATADALFESWLADDPRWGFGWIGWAACYHDRAGLPADEGRAEALLRRGYSISEVRDRGVIAEWLQMLCEESGRRAEAREFAREAKQLRNRPRTPVRVGRQAVLEDHADGTDTVRTTTTLTFEGEGLPLDLLPDVLRAATTTAPAEPVPPAKVGRNAPCPCGSARKLKKCCGSVN